MISKDFFRALDELEKAKGIPKDVIISAIEQALTTAYKKNFNQSQNVRVEFKDKTNKILVYAQKTVVEEVINQNEEISLEEALTKSKAYKIGDIIEIEVTPKNFGRIAAQTAKQIVTQRIREAEREVIFSEFADREQDIITGIMSRHDGKYVHIDLGKAEALLPLSEMLEKDAFIPSSRVKVFISKIENTTKGPLILVSRKDPGLVKRLFELEVPEVYEGVIEIMSLSRDAGDRTKVCVRSHDADVDPVGACIGNNGSRINNIVEELNGEKIDLAKWSKDPKELIANALAPAKVLSVNILDEKKKTSQVIVPDTQLSLAIGKRGQNARLAAQLTGWKIDIKSEKQAEKVGIKYEPNVNLPKQNKGE